MAEGIAQHQRADLHALCRFGQRRQHGPAFPNAPGRLARIAIEEVVSEPDAIEAIRFRLARDGADRLIRTLAVGFAVVRLEDQQSNLHGFLSTFFGTREHPPRSVLPCNPQPLLSLFIRSVRECSSIYFNGTLKWGENRS